jgi:uncharacterized protein (TIGR00251 family)
MSKRRPSTEDSTLRIKVLPRSSVNGVMGFEGDVLRVKVTAAPVDGSANQNLIQLLSKSLKLEKDSIRIVSGQKSRLKVVRICGIKKDELSRRLKNASQS